MFRLIPYFFLVVAAEALAEPVRVAVASNFARPARQLAADFEAATGESVTLVPASTGKLYAQIVAGAPFDLFLAADVERPRRLVDAGLAVEQRDYALGRLVVLSADPQLASVNCVDAMADAPSSATLAIANPRSAPYGRAAEDWLAETGSGLRIVVGESVGQAMNFVVSGNAQFGIVAASQFTAIEASWPGCATLLPGDAYGAIRQSAALLSRGQQNRTARAFYDFLFTASARDRIASLGYALPGAG